MRSPNNLQKYVLFKKMIRIKVVGVMKDYFLVILNLTLNLPLKVVLNRNPLFDSGFEKGGKLTFRYVVMSVIKVRLFGAKIYLT